MNKISFGNGESQKQNMGSSLVSSLVSTGVTAGVGALGGAGVAKVASLVPTTKPTEGKIVEAMMDAGDTFVKDQVKIMDDISSAHGCEEILAEIDDKLDSIMNGGKKLFSFKKTDPTLEAQSYLRSIMDKIGVKVEDGVDLTKEQVKEALKNKRNTFTTAPLEKFREIYTTAEQGLLGKAKEYLKTAKKGDEIFDTAVKATHKMKNDMRLSSFAKWGAIIALGLSIIPNFIPKKAPKETMQA